MAHRRDKKKRDRPRCGMCHRRMVRIPRDQVPGIGPTAIPYACDRCPVGVIQLPDGGHVLRPDLSPYMIKLPPEPAGHPNELTMHPENWGVVQLPVRLKPYYDELLSSGIYGANVQSATERIVEQGLQSLIRDSDLKRRRDGKPRKEY